MKDLASATSDSPIDRRQRGSLFTARAQHHGESTNRAIYVLTVAAIAGCALAGCSSSSPSPAATTQAAASSAATSPSSASPATVASATSAAPSTATSTAASASTDLPSLIPTPAGNQRTDGPDAIAENGIHQHFVVNGSPVDVMNAYKTALEGNGWTVTATNSGGGGGGGGATYTGTNGDAYGVFTGGGYGSISDVEACAWPSKPTSTDCGQHD